MSVAPYFKCLPNLPAVCATALVVRWNNIYIFIQEFADLNVCDVHSVDFVISHMLLIKLCEHFV